MAEHERMRAKRKLDAAVAELTKEQRRLEEVDVLARSQTLVTVENHRKATKLLEQTRSERDHRKVSQEEKIQSERSRRLANVLHLKSEMEGITKSLKNNTERKAYKRERATLALAASKDTMIASGINPYAEFRRLEIEQETQTERDKLVARVELGKTRVLEDMEVERARVVKADRLSAKAKVRLT